MADDWAEDAPRPTGRPSSYTRELADAILHSIAVDAMSLRHACATHDVPPGTFCGWVVDDVDGLSERYRRARRIKAHSRLDEMFEIADNTADDFIFEDGKLVMNREAIQRSQLRVATRQWALARELRDEFGEKVELTGKGGGAIVVAKVDLSEMTDEQLDALERLRAQMAGKPASADGT